MAASKFDNANLIFHTKLGNGANALWLHLITFTQRNSSRQTMITSVTKISNKFTIARKKSAIREKNPTLS
jgi:hypothetical protein